MIKKKPKKYQQINKKVVNVNKFADTSKPTKKRIIELVVTKVAATEKSPSS